MVDDPHAEVVAGLRAISDPADRAVAAHDLLRRIQHTVEVVALTRHEAVVELRAAGWSHAQVARLLGVHRNRAQHIAEG